MYFGPHEGEGQIDPVPKYHAMKTYLLLK